MARKLTDLAIRNLKPGPARREIPDRGGLYVVLQPSGHRSFAVRYRLGGVPKKHTLGNFPGLTLAAARKLASDAIYDVARGIDPSEAKKTAQAKAAVAAKDTLQAICEEYQRRDGKNLRTAKVRAGNLQRMVYPVLGSRQIDGIKRSEIIRLLDKIEDENGPRQADLVLALLSRIFNWHASRSDEFRSPIVRGMARGKPKERARSRILNDDELRAVWRAAGEAGEFGALIKFLLLSCARRAEAARMVWSEIEGDVWNLPASRNKVKTDLSRPLSRAAQAILAERPRVDGCPYIFSNDGRRPITGFSHLKARFDKACGVVDWRIHDLRRVARSLMSRAGIGADIAERALGHVMPTIRQTYDRHSFHDEKRHAFEALASLIERIVSPPENNVRQLRGR
jgi:integrase